uniref:Small ubiquitin-related modifier 3 n=1 Tax=Nosema pernyi TaxID=1112939 RepID=A0A0N7ABY8_9MICR|nr:small ubiquitin-related modifier 3 [Nosema pernyi]
MEEERENSDAQNNKIKLKIIDQDGAILEFKVKKGITFRKILKTFADQVNKDPSELRLVFNGKVLDLESTPDFYNMEDNDEVEVVASQVGGFN